MSKQEITEADEVVGYAQMEKISEKEERPAQEARTPGDKQEISEISEICEISEPEHGAVVVGPEEHHHFDWIERLQKNRPDRLFPYPSAKDNINAIVNFMRRYFLLFLIIPAWVLPNVLTAKAKHEQELLHGGGLDNTTSSHAALEFAGLQYMTLASAEGGGGGAHGPELSKGANWAIFLLNMLVMMHMGKAANAALEELVPGLGPATVSVIDAMTSSTVELAVAAFALKNGLVVIVQAAMLGAILNNLLLVMGIAILVGGIVNHQQKLKKETTQTSMNILMLTSIAYVIPIGLESTLTYLHKANRPTVTDPLLLRTVNNEIRKIVDKDILTLSKFMAFVLLGIYFACLFYQYYHREFMITPEVKHEGPHTHHIRYTHYWFAGSAYLFAMAAQIYSAYHLVHAVEGLGRLHHLNDSFVGFVLLPIVLVADLQEEIVAIRESKANRLDKTLSLMVGSCMQIALLVTPILVLMGWMMGVPMTFKFTILEVVILASSVLITNYLLADGETNWLEGSLLLAAFVICAIAFFYDDSHLSVLPGEGNTIGGGGGGH